MPGVGHGGPAKGRATSVSHRQNAEASRHYALESRIAEATVVERAAVKALVTKNAKSKDDAALLLSMLLGDE